MSFQCDICNYFSTRTNDLKKHNKTKKHLKKVYDNTKMGVKTIELVEEPKKAPDLAPIGSQKAPKMDQICEFCGKEYSKKSNLNKHLSSKHNIDNRKFIVENKVKSKKRLQKIGIRAETLSRKLAGLPPELADLRQKKSISCEYCSKKFGHMSSLSRHLKNRCKIKDQKMDVFYLLKQENQNMKKKLDEKDKIITKKDDIIDNATKANKYAMSTFNILVKEFAHSPALKNIEKHDIETIVYKDVDKDDESDLVDALIYYHAHKRLSQHIGDSIVSLYKKDDPHTQSFWNTDTQRLSYVIRSILYDDLEWIKDMGGKKISKMVVVPVIEYIDKTVRHHIRTVPMNQFHDAANYHEHLAETHKLSCELKDKKILSKEILGYITPFFHFPVNNLLQLIE